MSTPLAGLWSPVDADEAAPSSTAVVPLPATNVSARVETPVAAAPAAAPAAAAPRPNDGADAVGLQRALLDELAEWREQQQRQWALGFVTTCLLAVWLISHLDRLTRQLALTPVPR